MADYRVGQILYVIPAKSASVVPVQVVERRISETTDGIVVKHLIKNPKPKAPAIILESIDGQIFMDLKSVRSLMVHNATIAIDGMLSQAQAIAAKAFGQEKRVIQAVEPFDLTDYKDETFEGDMPQSTEAPSNVDVTGEQMVEIMTPDGQKQMARVKSK